MDFSVGKRVIARYPETTSFYRAIITGGKQDVYSVVYEDDDQGPELEVEKRYVLDINRN